jgi:hypothetical protein
MKEGLGGDGEGAEGRARGGTHSMSWHLRACTVVGSMIGRCVYRFVFVFVLDLFQRLHCNALLVRSDYHMQEASLFRGSHIHPAMQ